MSYVLEWERQKKWHTVLLRVFVLGLGIGA
jgi:hypothetical protein